MPKPLADTTGEFGETLFELTVTDYHHIGEPLFKPSFMGEKWEAIDFYIELLGLSGTRPFFFVQVKTTDKPLKSNAKSIEISVSKRDCERLFEVPGPTYLAGAHAPTRKVYLLSIHDVPKHGITRIPLANELTQANLRILYNEVRDLWNGLSIKSGGSHFQ